MAGSMPRVPTEVLWSSYQDLGSLRAVAERHGYASAYSIGKRFRDANLPRHPKHITVGGRDVCPIEELIAVFERTHDYYEVARLCSSSYAAVKTRLRNAGYSKTGRVS